MVGTRRSGDTVVNRESGDKSDIENLNTVSELDDYLLLSKIISKLSITH